MGHQSITTEHPPLESYNVIILDDDAEFGELIRSYLGINGFSRVDYVCSADEFWEKMRNYRADLIILDYHLHDTTGFHIIDRLKELGNSTPIIMMTGRGDEHIAAQAIQRGAAEYLVKGEDFLPGLPALIQNTIRMDNMRQTVGRLGEQIRFQVLMLNNLKDAVVVWDLNQWITFWNPSSEELFGWSASDRIGMPIQEGLFGLFDPPLTQEFIVSQFNKNIERPVCHKDGRKLWLSITPIQLKDMGGSHSPLGTMLVCRDITPLKTAESNLQARLEIERLISNITRHLVNVGPDQADAGLQDGLIKLAEFTSADCASIQIIPAEGQNPEIRFFWKRQGLSTSPTILRLMPLDHMAWLRHRLKVNSYVHMPRIRDLPDEANMERAFFMNKGVRSCIMLPLIYKGLLFGLLEIATCEEEKTWGEDDIFLLRAVSDSFTNALARKWYESQLRRSEARYRAIVEDHQTDMICRFRPDGTLNFVNEAFIANFNLSRDELLGHKITQWLHPEDSAANLPTIQTLTPAQPSALVEYRVQIPGSGLVWHEWSIRAIFSAEGKATEYQGVGRNITARKNLEEQVARAYAQLVYTSRLTAIGSLAASVAHQISNPLTSILGEAQILQQSSKDENILESARLILKAGWRAQSVIQNLMEFSELSSEAYEPVNVEQTIHQAVSLAEKTLSDHDIELEVEISPGLPASIGLSRQLAHVWLNLLLYARRPFYGEGRVQKIILRARSEESGGVIVQIEDDGEPVSEKEVESFFEPVLLPPSAGMGSGMELSICREIIRQFGGQITMNSSALKRTIFEIILPGDKSNGTI